MMDFDKMDQDHLKCRYLTVKRDTKYCCMCKKKNLILLVITRTYSYIIDNESGKICYLEVFVFYLN